MVFRLNAEKVRCQTRSPVCVCQSNHSLTSRNKHPENQKSSKLMKKKNKNSPNLKKINHQKIHTPKETGITRGYNHLLFLRTVNRLIGLKVNVQRSFRCEQAIINSTLHSRSDNRNILTYALILLQFESVVLYIQGDPCSSYMINVFSGQCMLVNAYNASLNTTRIF